LRRRWRAAQCITVPIRHGERTIERAAELWLPPGAGPHPVMILLHGSSGRSGRETHYRDALLPLGIGVTITDHLGPRGVRSTAEQQDAVPTSAFVADPRALRQVLDANPQVDPTRIGAAGFSKGGGPLLALETRHADPQAARQRRLAGTSRLAGRAGRLCARVPRAPARRLTDPVSDSRSGG
jgi:dienelactone hydrolase